MANFGKTVVKIGRFPNYLGSKPSWSLALPPALPVDALIAASKLPSWHCIRLP
jgi:hypothetical protein